MNPFELPGPDFLALYVIFCLAVTIAHRMLRALSESRTAPRLPLADPYQIAWLRGGAREVVRIAVLSLIDRQYLEVLETKLVRRAASGAKQPRPGIERAIYTLAEDPAEAKDIYADASIQAVCTGYRRQLAQAGLMPDTDLLRKRRLLYALALALVLGPAAAKMALALARGHWNIGFLGIAATIANYILWRQYQQERTYLGDAVLSDLRSLFSRRRRRAEPLLRRPMTGDEMLRSAVLGSDDQPAADASGWWWFTMQWSSDGGSGGGSSSSSSSSHSTCGSGSSSCGSGGSSCGGGGGGCGGCGS